MHFLRQPDYHYLKIRFKRLQAEFFYYFRGFGRKYHTLGISNIYRIHPVVKGEIGRLIYKLSPFFYIIVADWIRGFLPFYYREYKVKIGMDQFLILYTRFTYSTRVSVCTVLATDISSICQSQCHTATTFCSCKKLRMAYSFFLYSPEKF